MNGGPEISKPSLGGCYGRTGSQNAQQNYTFKMSNQVLNGCAPSLKVSGAEVSNLGAEEMQLRSQTPSD